MNAYTVKGTSHNCKINTYVNTMCCDASRTPFTYLYLTYHHTFSMEMNILLDSLQISCSTLNLSATQFVPLSDKKDENSASFILSTFLTSKLIDISNKNETDDVSQREILSNLRKNNVNKIINRYLNINYIRNKFEYFKYLIVEYVDVILISETKLYNTFPQCLYGLFHTPYREGRADKRGRLLLHIRQHIPCRNICFNLCPNKLLLLKLLLLKLLLLKLLLLKLLLLKLLLLKLLLLKLLLLKLLLLKLLLLKLLLLKLLLLKLLLLKLLLLKLLLLKLLLLKLLLLKLLLLKLLLLKLLLLKLLLLKLLLLKLLLLKLLLLKLLLLKLLLLKLLLLKLLLLKLLLLKLLLLKLLLLKLLLLKLLLLKLLLLKLLLLKLT